MHAVAAADATEERLKTARRRLQIAEQEGNTEISEMCRQQIARIEQAVQKILPKQARLPMLEAEANNLLEMEGPLHT